MTAGKVAMDLFDQAAVDHINDLGDYARTSITEAIRESAIEACVTGAGSMFRIHLKPESPLDYRSAYMCPLEQQRINELVNHMFASGFMMLNTCTAALSTVMNREHVDRLVDSLVEGFHQLERSG